MHLASAFDSAFDRTTWQALTVLLTVLGLVATVLLWRRRGAVAGLRAFALTLLPAAAYLTGAIRMLWQIGDAVVSFVVRLTFSPMVWTGVALAGLAVVLWVLAGFLSSRRNGRTSVARGEDAARRPVEQKRTAGAAAGERSGAAPAGTDAGTDGLDDIEAILRRHGIE